MDDDGVANAIAASTVTVITYSELLDPDQPSAGGTEEQHRVKRPRNIRPRQLCEDPLFGQMLAAPQTTEDKLFTKPFRLLYKAY